MNLKKKIGKVFTSKSVGTGPSSYEKRTYRAPVSQRLRNTVLNQGGMYSNHCTFKNKQEDDFIGEGYFGNQNQVICQVRRNTSE